MLIGKPSQTLSRQYRMFLTWPQRTGSMGERGTKRETEWESWGPTKWPQGICAAVKPWRSVNKQAGCCFTINHGLERCFISNCHVLWQRGTCSLISCVPKSLQYLSHVSTVLSAEQDVFSCFSMREQSLKLSLSNGAAAGRN